MNSSDHNKNSSFRVCDLHGFGEAIGHLKDLLLLLVEWRATSRHRELRAEEQQLRNNALRLDIACRLAKVAQEWGYSKTELRELLRLKNKRDITNFLGTDGTNQSCSQKLRDKKK